MSETLQQFLALSVLLITQLKIKIKHLNNPQPHCKYTFQKLSKILPTKNSQSIIIIIISRLKTFLSAQKSPKQPKHKEGWQINAAEKWSHFILHRVKFKWPETRVAHYASSQHEKFFFLVSLQLKTYRSAGSPLCGARILF